MAKNFADAARRKLDKGKSKPVTEEAPAPVKVTQLSPNTTQLSETDAKITHVSPSITQLSETGPNVTQLSSDADKKEGKAVRKHRNFTRPRELKTERGNFCLTASTFAKLRELSSATGQSLSAVVDKAVVNYYEQFTADNGQ